MTPAFKNKNDYDNFCCELDSIERSAIFLRSDLEKYLSNDKPFFDTEKLKQWYENARLFFGQYKNFEKFGEMYREFSYKSEFFEHIEEEKIKDKQWADVLLDVFEEKINMLPRYRLPSLALYDTKESETPTATIEEISIEYGDTHQVIFNFEGKKKQGKRFQFDGKNDNIFKILFENAGKKYDINELIKESKQNISTVEGVLSRMINDFGFKNELKQAFFNVTKNSIVLRRSVDKDFLKKHSINVDKLKSQLMKLDDF